jgi:hypothetical protein
MKWYATIKVRGGTLIPIITRDSGNVNLDTFEEIKDANYAWARVFGLSFGVTNRWSIRVRR